MADTQFLKKILAHTEKTIARDDVSPEIKSMLKVQAERIALEISASELPAKKASRSRSPVKPKRGSRRGRTK